MDLMKKRINRYICIEIGKSAYTEYKMQSGEFETTEDGIFLGTVFADTKYEAIEFLKNNPEYKNRKFDEIVVFKIV